MKLKFLCSLLLTLCVSAGLCMCGDDSSTPEYTFPDGPGGGDKPEEPDQPKNPYPAGLTVTEFTDDLGNGKQCLGFVAVVDRNANPKLRFNAVHLPKQKTPTAIHAAFASEGKGTPYVTIQPPQIKPAK